MNVKLEYYFNFFKFYQIDVYSTNNILETVELLLVDHITPFLFLSLSNTKMHTHTPLVRTHIFFYCFKNINWHTHHTKHKARYFNCAFSNDAIEFCFFILLISSHPFSSFENKRISNPIDFWHDDSVWKHFVLRRFFLLNINIIIGRIERKKIFLLDIEIPINK